MSSHRRSRLSLPQYEIRAEDAINMSFLEDDSVDRVFGMNVIYFLDPLDAYLNEIKRVLKPGGKLVWGGKFQVGGVGHHAFKNLDLDKCSAAMREAGFDVATSSARLEGFAAYQALIGEKPTAPLTSSASISPAARQAVRRASVASTDQWQP